MSQRRDKSQRAPQGSQGERTPAQGHAGAQRESHSLALGMSIGVALGIGFGALFGHIAIGMGAGLCVGAAIGLMLDARARK